MKIKITGASGYLGQTISKKLKENGHEVTGLERKYLYGSIDDLQDEIKNCDAIINLAGAPILQRWTDKNKATILESRVKTTQNLVRAINNLPMEEQPKKFISASAIGIYKPGFTHDESSQNFDDSFVGNVVKQWEAASSGLSSNVQRNVFRIGLVLGKEAKTITNLLLPFKLGLGATLGKGEQAFPFVHVKDVARAFVWAIEDLNGNGTFNLVAPENITNKDFTKALARALHRPAIFSIPRFVLNTVLGEAASLLTEGANVEPRHLVERGFKFDYPTIKKALEEIV
jgi:uncharacterized protein (TIGR01777 family)